MFRRHLGDTKLLETQQTCELYCSPVFCFTYLMYFHESKAYVGHFHINANANRSLGQIPIT